MQIVVPLAIMLILMIFASIRRPFLHKYNNIRLVVNMVIVMIIGGIFLFYSLGSVEDVHKSIGLQLPIIICSLLLICVVYSGAIIVYEIVQKIKKIKEGKDAAQYEEDE